MASLCPNCGRLKASNQAVSFEKNIIVNNLMQCYMYQITEGRQISMSWLFPQRKMLALQMSQFDYHRIYPWVFEPSTRVTKACHSFPCCVQVVGLTGITLILSLSAMWINSGDLRACKSTLLHERGKNGEKKTNKKRTAQKDVEECHAVRRGSFIIGDKVAAVSHLVAARRV